MGGGIQLKAGSPRTTLVGGGAFAAIVEGACVKVAQQQLEQPLALRGWLSQTAAKAEGGAGERIVPFRGAFPYLASPKATSLH